MPFTSIYKSQLIVDVQVQLLIPGQTFSVPVSLLTPATVDSFTRLQANTFSSLSASSLMSDYDQR